jgi:hypothetical protein
MKGYWDGVLFFVLVGLFTVTVGSFLNKLTEYGSLGAAFEAWELRDWKEVLVSLGVSFFSVWPSDGCLFDLFGLDARKKATNKKAKYFDFRFRDKVPNLGS